VAALCIRSLNLCTCILSGDPTSYEAEAPYIGLNGTRPDMITLMCFVRCPMTLCVVAPQEHHGATLQ